MVKDIASSQNIDKSRKIVLRFNLDDNTIDFLINLVEDMDIIK